LSVPFIVGTNILNHIRSLRSIGIPTALKDAFSSPSEGRSLPVTSLNESM
jgi:hypothetical protein